MSGLPVRMITGNLGWLSRIEASKSRPEDLRAHYRRALGKGVALGVQVMSSDGLPMSGQLIDLSAGGASIE